MKLGARISDTKKWCQALKVEIAMGSRGSGFYVWKIAMKALGGIYSYP